MAQDFFVLCNKWFFISIMDLKYEGINKSSLCCSEEIIKYVGSALAHGTVTELKWS